MGNIIDEKIAYKSGCYTFLHIIQLLYGSIISGTYNTQDLPCGSRVAANSQPVEMAINITSSSWPQGRLSPRGPQGARAMWPVRLTPDNYANPVYGVATICHQVRWLRWGHPSLFHIATSLLILYKMFCVRDISHRLIWIKFINMFSVFAQSGTDSRFNW